MCKNNSVLNQVVEDFIKYHNIMQSLIRLHRENLCNIKNSSLFLTSRDNVLSTALICALNVNYPYLCTKHSSTEP